MPRLIDRLAGAPPALWLDDTDYTGRLLAAGHTPWLSSAEYVALRRKAQGLLRADVLVLPLTGFFHAAVSAQPALREAMAAKKRAVVPARTLLADESLRAHLVDVLKGLRGAFASLPLVLSLPSPRALVTEAWQLAFGEGAQVEVGGDEADACAVYVAEFLRSFGECGIDGLLLEERADAEPASADELAWYQPVINVAGHYRWDLGLRLPSAAGFAGEVTGLQFVIAPRVVTGAATGLDLGAGYWSGAPVPAAPAGGFRYAQVPADAVPEVVLERLAGLRA